MKPCAPFFAQSRGLWPVLKQVLFILGWLALASCGGGGISVSGGVGSGGTGLADGTLSGFGSVIVDGLTYTDTNAAVVREDADGVALNTDAKLGQRVRVAYTSTTAGDVATRVEVLPQLIGPVTRVVGSDGLVQVLGQSVRVAEVSGLMGEALTVMAGVSQASALALNDEVEVHGTWVWNAVASVYELRASRIEKQSTVSSTVLLNGVMSDIQRLGGVTTFGINGNLGRLQVAQLPSDAVVGTLVRIWIDRAALATRPWVAKRVVRASLSTVDVADRSTLRLGAHAARFDTPSRQLEVQGLRLDVPSGVDADDDALNRGDYVSVAVTRQGNQWVVDKAQARTATAGLGNTVEIKGVANDIDFNTTLPVSFSLRGVDVVAGAGAIESNCRQALANADLQLEVTGQVVSGSAAVQAQRVRCTAVLGSQVVVERRGMVASVDTAQQRLVVLTVEGPVAALWDANSFFEQRPDMLSGRKVEIEGVYTNGSDLRIRRVRLR
jgi:hypothetical protein